MKNMTRISGLRINKRIIGLFLIPLLTIGCNDDPLFDILHEKRVLLFMKGTYSSNDPKGHGSYTGRNDDSVLTKEVYIRDISSLRLDLAQVGVTKSIKGNDQVRDENVHKLSDVRQLFFFKYTDNPTFTKEELFNKNDLKDPNLTQKEIDRLIALRIRQNSEFFNDSGYGVYYKGKDTKGGYYSKFRLFIRRIITDHGAFFNKTPNNKLIDRAVPAKSTYNNDIVEGHEISDYYRFFPDEYGQLTAANFLFPYTISREFYIPHDGPVHIEFRFFAKNSMKKYEAGSIKPFQVETNGEKKTYQYVKFWAFPDVVHNYRYDSGSMIGNFLMGFHIYNPLTAGTIRGTVPYRYLKNNRLKNEYYIAVVPEGAPPPVDYIPDMATGKAPGGLFTVTHVNPGFYDVYLMQDINSSANEDERDGFPETVVDKPKTVFVGENETVEVHF